MARRWALMAATPAALAGLAIGTSAAFGASQAGKPVPNSYLLCGLYTAGNENNFAGSSDTDHPDGSSSMGQEYQYAGQNCESENGQTGDGTYTWTIDHSMVHTAGHNGETGVEHVEFTMDVTGNRASGAQGHISNYDLSSVDNVGDPCGNRIIFRTSGHNYDSATCSGGTVGNFNTHGGAETGDYFRGNYQSVVYQWGDNMSQSPCKEGSMDYCFEAILEGQTN